MGTTLKRAFGLAALLWAGFALAHEQPSGGVADWVMTDWMLLTAFFGFMLPALLVTFVAWRRGALHHLEGAAKTAWMATPEPDFDTSPWAWEELPEWAREARP